MHLLALFQLEQPTTPSNAHEKGGITNYTALQYSTAQVPRYVNAPALAPPSAVTTMPGTPIPKTPTKEQESDEESSELGEGETDMAFEPSLRCDVLIYRRVKGGVCGRANTLARYQEINKSVRSCSLVSVNGATINFMATAPLRWDVQPERTTAWRRPLGSDRRRCLDRRLIACRRTDDDQAKCRRRTLHHWQEREGRQLCANGPCAVSRRVRSSRMNNLFYSLSSSLHSVKVENCVLSRQTRVGEGATLKDCDSRPGAEVIAKGARKSKPYMCQGDLTRGSQLRTKAFVWTGQKI